MSADHSDEVRLDYSRERRKGVGEVVYCSGKSDEQLSLIASDIRSRRMNMAFSRLSTEQAELIAPGDPPMSYNPVSKLGLIEFTPAPRLGATVAVISAGSSDVPAALEAAEIVQFLGCDTQKFFDVGVAGLHRLLDSLPEIRDADIAIVAAGMDGALPTVVAGLVPCLVIGLPTSVGYGIASGGAVALNTMLSSCSPGMVVVNIDNGIGAGLAAVVAAKKMSRPACPAVIIARAAERKLKYAEELPDIREEPPDDL
ncbi:MAG: nickel pincer cofactor biosynthesis protein LarB [Synergistaceae bacterium]|jgi:NCAIR mutase (PurE)-related protein|nr:nickel pincer cofactor biosynthesis protein LarB [Synergistaceae bacterium]